MILSCIGLPQDRSGIYGQCQDWLQNHGLGVYEPQRRYKEGTLPGEWNGAGFNWRPATVAMLRELHAPMLWHVGSYYYSTRPQILLNAIPHLRAMLEVLLDLGITYPWFLIDEPPHAVKYGWTQDVEDDVVSFADAALSAGFEVAVAIPGPTQYAFWQQRLDPSWWILHANANWAGIDTKDCWLYNAETYTHLAAQLRAAGAVGYLQWSGVRTTVNGPVPILFDAAGVATDAAWELVRQLGQAQDPATVEERVTDLERRVTALEKR